MDKDTREKFGVRLAAQRNELLARLGNIDESWRQAAEREIEFEETAAKESLIPYLDRLDEMDKRQLEAIDRALGRLKDDVYDVCENCGEPISLRRLEAVPWTTRCIECAAEEDRGRGRPIEVESPEEAELPEELRGLTDDEVAEAVMDAVREKGSIADEELRVSFRDGVLFLEGLLPNKAQHSHLEQIVYDVLGFTEVEDTIRLDRTAWQREDRTPGIDVEAEEPAPEDASDDSGPGSTIEAIKEGKTISPADEIVPEEGSGRKE